MKNIFHFALIALLLVACGGPSTEADPAQEGDKGMPVHEMTARITVMEDTLFAKPYFDAKGAQALVDVYKAFVTAHPLDTISPEYLFRAASVSKALGRPEDAIKLYDRVIADYPGWRRIADAYYLKAFTIDSDLGQKGEAELAYKEVISRFPDHAFAADAKAMIENLQYTDAELIERFEKMNAGSVEASK